MDKTAQRKKTQQEMLGKLKPPSPKIADHLKKKSSKSDTAAFEKLFEKPTEIKTVKGEVVKFPELLFDAEFDLIFAVKQLIGKLEGRGWETILDDILETEGSKEKILKIASIVMGKDAKYIRENFTMGMLVSLLAPFLVPIVMGKNINSILPMWMESQKVH